MHQIADGLVAAIPLATTDYALRGMFPWLDSLNDWISNSWLGAPMPTWLGFLMWFSLGAVSRRKD